MLMKRYLRGTNLTLPVLSLIVYLDCGNGKIGPPLVEEERLRNLVTIAGDANKDGNDIA
jgi:hypothetical protein